MRLLVYSDLQADEGSSKLFSDQTVPLQRWRVTKFLNWLHAVFLEEECDGLIDLGDTIDSRNSVAHPTIMAVMNGLHPFSTTRKHNVKLIGNHDQWSKSGEFHVGPMFESVFRVVPAIESIGAGVFASFMTDVAQQSEILKSTIKDNSMLFGHFQVLGSRMNSGLSTSGVPKEAFEKAKLTLLGHVHSHQQVSESGWYLGSPFQQDFGESNDKKYVAIVDTQTNKPTFVEVPGFPTYRSVSIDEFERRFDPTSEDRWQVILGSYQEAERLYAHPFAGRVNSTYVYEPVADSPGVESAEDVVMHDWSVPAAMKKYLEVVPPSTKGVELSPTELIDFAVTVSKTVA